MITFKQFEYSQIEIISQMMIDFYAIDNYPIEIDKTKDLLNEFIAYANSQKTEQKMIRQLFSNRLFYKI